MKIENLTEEWYTTIAKVRDLLLEQSKKHAKELDCEEADTYAFIKAVGMTDCLRLLDDIAPKYHLKTYHKFLRLVFDDIPEDEYEWRYTTTDFIDATLVEIADMFIDISTMKEAIKLKTSYSDFSEWYYEDFDNYNKNKKTQSLTEFIKKKRKK